MDEKIGIVGVNSRAVACSAKRLDLTVYVVDYFMDVDTQRTADFHYPLQDNRLRPDLEGEYSQDKLVDAAIENLDGKVDSLIITSDLGCNPKLIRRLEKYFRVLGNNWQQVAKAKNWGVLEKMLDELGILCPRTITARSFEDMMDAAYLLDFPVVVKSLIKGMEVTPTLIERPEDMEHYRKIQFNEDVLIQEPIIGETVSASVLSDGCDAITLSVNKQLTGVREFGAEKKFVYCGNLVPLDSPYYDRISILSSRLISQLGLTGSNGVDYILSDEGGIYFMEVNTRFQDTLECVEKFRRINLVEEHIKAVGGEITALKEKSNRCYGKGILYADRDLQVGDLTKIEDVGDIPLPSARIRRAEPICSIYSDGKNNKETFSRLLTKAKTIRNRFPR